LALSPLSREEEEEEEEPGVWSCCCEVAGLVGVVVFFALLACLLAPALTVVPLLPFVFLVGLFVVLLLPIVDAAVGE
jgi:hypothetical protein